MERYISRESSGVPNNFYEQTDELRIPWDPPACSYGSFPQIRRKPKREIQLILRETEFKLSDMRRLASRFFVGTNIPAPFGILQSASEPVLGIA